MDSHASDVYNFTYENGRRYASTELGHYYMPNDEPEIQRLNQQHWMLTVVKEGRLHNAPLPDRPLKILDVGCGSGIWAIQMAEEYPSALITGMDISPIQPAKKPANVDWIVHDMEKDWPVPEDYFDFIHLSLVHGCVADWRSMMNKIVGSVGKRHWLLYIAKNQQALGARRCSRASGICTGKPVRCRRLGQAHAVFRKGRRATASNPLEQNDVQRR